MSTKSGLSQRSYESAGNDRPGEWVNRFNAIDEDRLRRALEVERASMRAEFTIELNEARAEFRKRYSDQLPWLYFGFWCVITLSLMSLVLSVVGRG
jgi:hypothetical protein